MEGEFSKLGRDSHGNGECREEKGGVCGDVVLSVPGFQPHKERSSRTPRRKWRLGIETIETERIQDLPPQ